jgi:hypothetical protein
MITYPSDVRHFEEELKKRLAVKKNTFLDSLVKRCGTEMDRDELRGRIIQIDDIDMIISCILQDLYA